MRLACMPLTLGPLVLTLLLNHCTAVFEEEQNEEQQKVCRYLGKEFQYGELVTENVCDRCFCTQHGIMCEMIHCPTANCHDKVWKDCCYRCPDGPNCLYEGENGTVLVSTEESCTYNDREICRCYYDNKKADQERVLCTWAAPGESRPPCKAVEP